MKRFKILLLLLLLSTYSLYGASSQDDVKVAIIGKLSNFIKWNENTQKHDFTITVLKDEAFTELLNEHYNGRMINAKRVLVYHANSMDDLVDSDILYIGELSQAEQYQFIDYAKNNSILTISQAKGFAQRGGLIQLYFVSEKVRLKINHEASKESNLKISAALLSIATIVKGTQR